MKTNSAQSCSGTPARAFTVTELLITVACIALLAAIFLPALRRPHEPSSRLGCANYLKQIGLAFRTWSLDNSDHFPMQVSVTNGGTMELVVGGAVFPHFQVMSNELSIPRVLACPNDNGRTYVTNFLELTDRNLSYFVNMDATYEAGSTLLCGDRNITNRAPAGSRLVSLTRGDTIAWTREIHSEKGNVAFGDGRVDLFSNKSVRSAIRTVGGTTNRLAVP